MKRKIAIVGGGMAGLSAAYQLTRTPELQALHEVTVYEMSWRLGGKCASWRERGRNVEHGLHIWFGYYENAFRLLREVYEAWEPEPEWQIRVRDVRDAVKRQPFTPVGRGAEGWHSVFWPPKDDFPGDGPTRLGILSCILGIVELVNGLWGAMLSSEVDIEIQLEGGALRTLESIEPLPATRAVAGPRIVRAGACLEAAFKIAAELEANISPNLAPAHSDDVLQLAEALSEVAGRVMETTKARTSPWDLPAQTLDIAAAIVMGVVTDVLVHERPIKEIDELDFREWLLLHGAANVSVDQSPAVRALYDTMFQYPDGDPSAASYGAGTALQVVLRMLGTYKGMLAWELTAGTGEVVVAPLYEVLKQRDVRFRFFHKLSRIDLTPDRRAVERLVFTLDDSATNYEPVKPCKGLLRWQDPRSGDGRRDAGIDLESHRRNQTVDDVCLAQGKDFDDAILAIPVGAFNELDGSPGPCHALLAASERFAGMAENLPLVPSISVQVWCRRDLSELGWNDKPPAMVSGPPPLGIWADMTHLLAHESDTSSDRPLSLHYFCDVFKSYLHRRPPSESGVQEQGKQDAVSLAEEWFEKSAAKIWRYATLGKRNQFDWSVLYGYRQGRGIGKLDAQVVRANVSPSDCCVSSAAGTTAWRLAADQSGFNHLYLAGSWIDTGFNTECIEAAIMSGMQAARAICGEPKAVPGERFLHTRPLPGPFDLLRAAAAVLFGTGPRDRERGVTT